MPRFAANLDWLFTEIPFLERFGAASAAGFCGVEFLFPYEYPSAQIAALLETHRLENVLFNLPAGNWKGGERGIASLPGREIEFRESVDLALSYALALGTRRLHVLAGIINSASDRARCLATYLENLRYASSKFAPHGIILLIEAINACDMPGYLVGTQADSFELCEAVGAENVRMQIDLYHMQMTEGCLAAGLRRYRSHCAHVQVAGVPGRNEPSCCEVNYPYLFGLLDDLEYDGWVGCEYRPRRETLNGLSWLEMATSVPSSRPIDEPR